MPHVLGSSVSYRIAIAPQQGRKAFMISTIRPLDRPDAGLERVAKANGFSLQAGVSCKGHQKDKRERLRRYIARPAVAIPRLSLSPCGQGGLELEDALPGWNGHPVLVGQIADSVHPGRTAVRVLPHQLVSIPISFYRQGAPAESIKVEHAAISRQGSRVNRQGRAGRKKRQPEQQQRCAQQQGKRHDEPSNSH